MRTQKQANCYCCILLIGRESYFKKDYVSILKIATTKIQISDIYIKKLKKNFALLRKLYTVHAIPTKSIITYHLFLLCFKE